MNIAGATVAKWKKVSMPNDVTLVKIANYFNSSVEYLKTGQEPETKKDQLFSWADRLYKKEKAHWKQ